MVRMSKSSDGQSSLLRYGLLVPTLPSICSLAADEAKRLGLPWGVQARRGRGAPSRQRKYEDMLADVLREGQRVAEIALLDTKIAPD